MKVIEYKEKYLEEVKDLLVELEEYIISIDEDHLDQMGKDYREKMVVYDLEKVKNNHGKCFLAIQNDKVIGLIMGEVYQYDEEDSLDYKCPKKGYIRELIISKNAREKGIGTVLINQLESYFKSIECEYICLDVFAYNESAINFYTKCGYHTRMQNMIKKLSS
ncbi:MAG: GNAT family N-acetyltransferase [Clostridia bacterium]|nr:GNAT family N-acetyltransferase [Clostridia bacterium]